MTTRNSRRFGMQMQKTAVVALLGVALLVGCATPVAPPADPDAVLDALYGELDPLLRDEDFDAALARIDHVLAQHAGRVEQQLGLHAELRASRALVALEAGREEDAMADLRLAATFAARAGDWAAAQAHGDALSQLLDTTPEWVTRRGGEAEALPDDPDIQDGLEFLGALRQEAYAIAAEGDLAGALALLEDTVDMAEALFGPDHRLTVVGIVDLAELSFALGDAQGAESLLLHALARSSDRPGVGHPWTLAIQNTLADLFEAEGRGWDALEATDAAAAAAAAAFGATSPVTIDLEMRAARRLEAVGQYARGAERLERACADTEARFVQFHGRTADCLESYGTLLARGGDLEGAREALGGALAIRSRVLAPHAPATLQSRLDLTALGRANGAHDVTEAELAALEAEVATQLGDGELQLAVREARARNLFEMGRLEAAENLARQVLDARMAELGDDHPLTLDVLNLLGAVFQRNGNLPAAEDTWTAVVAGYRSRYGAEHLSTLTAMSNLGVVLEQQGAYDRAEPLLRSALEISEGLLGPAHPQTLVNMNNLALLFESQGNFSRAEPLYLLPIEILDSTVGGRHPQTIAVRNNLAFLYMMEQDYAGAVRLFEEVHAAWVDTLGATHQDTLRGLNNLGRAYRHLGRLDEARMRIDAALLERRNRFGARHPDTIRSLIDLGLVELDSGDAGRAEMRLREALALSEETLGAQHPYTFEALNALTEAFRADARTADAFELARMGFERRTRFFDRMLWVTSDNAREGYLRLHRPELDRYLQLLPELESASGARELIEVSLQRKGLLLKIASEIRQIAGLGLDPQMARLVDELVDAREALAALTLAGPGDRAPETHLTRIRDLESRVGDLQGALGRASLRYREAIAELSVTDLLSYLPDDGVLVDFLVYTRADGEQGLLAGILHKVPFEQQPRFHLVRYDAMAPIEAVIREFREIIQDVDALDEEVEFVGNLAWELIWQPVATHLPSNGQVFLVPDGVLNVLPFDALVDADGRYLLETTDIRLLSSARDLVPSAVPRSQGGFLVFGGPDYDTEEVAGPGVLEDARRRSVARVSLTSDVLASGDGAARAVAVSAGTRGSRSARFDAMRGVALADLDSRSANELASLRAASRSLRGLSFSPLPGAELEGQVIAALVGRQDAWSDNYRLYTGGAAEEQVLFDLDTAPRVLHMATHGFFLAADDNLQRRLLGQRGADIGVAPPGDNPLLRAGLAFAGVNSNAPFLGELDTRNDGVLTALEVLSLNLSGTELAVLSACDTGIGQIHEGEGVYGLRRAFQEAGVREVVTSLWEVSDVGTQALMTAFYGHMFDGMPARDALRQAQQDLKASPRWGYPFIWSAFVMVGN